MQDNGWDHGLTVAADGNGLVGHAGGVLLRKLADRCGLTAALDGALTQRCAFPRISRGMVLVPAAIAIAAGATAMADIEVLDQLAPVLGPAPSDSTVRRVLALASDLVLTRIAQARARIRKHVWGLIAATETGFPWLAVAGKTLAGRVVLDMDGTLVTAHGSNTVTDHAEVLGRALRQVPAMFRRKVLVRIDGAGASHDLVKYLLTLSTTRKTLLFTCGWMITESDEAAIAAVPESAWRPGLAQDGSLEEDKDVAEITHLMARAGIWPDRLRWIARRVKPSRRHLKNLTAYEKATGWKYSITCTNIGHTGMDGVPGSQHPQFIDVTHRDHATVETDGVRTAKAMGLRNLPSKTWQVNKGLGPRRGHRRRPHRLGPPPGPLRPGRTQGRSPRYAPLPVVAHPCPARPPRPQADPEDQPGLALARRLPRVLEPAVRLARTHLTSADYPSDSGRRLVPARSEPVHARAYRACTPAAPRSPNGHEA